MASVTEILGSLIEHRAMGDVLVLERYADGGEIVCDLLTFEKMVGTAQMTYAGLSDTSMAGSGWQKYFDAWKMQGIIS